MSTVVVLIALLTLGVYSQHYSSRWDNVNVDTVLKNERLLRTYFKCLLDQGKCSADAAELKKVIPEALENDCGKCSERQKEMVDKVIKHIINKKPDIYKQLEKKYDPKATYRSKHMERQTNETIKM